MAGTALGGSSTELSRRLTTVVAADICGYSRLAEVNESAAIRTVHLVRAAFEQAAVRRRGRVFHAAGDGFLAEFPSAADGVLAALDFVADIKARDAISPSGAGAKVRAGVHSGDVVEQPNGDLLGHGVNIAARLQSSADPNGVLASQSTVNLIREDIGARFERRGPLTLRNIEEPVMAFDLSRAAVSLPRGLAFRRLKRLRERLGWAGAAGIALALVASTNLFAVLVDAKPLQRSTPAIGAASLEKADDAGQPLALGGAGRVRTPDLDDRYLLRVLGDLASSNISADQAISALVQSGDIDRSLDFLERTLRSANLSDQARMETLHQIGALSSERDPSRSIAAYEEIVRISPNDFDANVRLGRAYVQQDKLGSARARFQTAEAIGAPDRRSAAELAIDFAALDLHAYKLEDAVSKLSSAILPGDDPRHSSTNARARTLLGLAFFSLGRRDEAKAQLIAAMATQRALGLNSELARALNIMGQIEAADGRFKTAVHYFNNQLSLERTLQSATGVVDASYFLGDAYLAMGDISLAETHFREGVLIATSKGILDGRFLNLIGMAKAASSKGDADRACDYLGEAAALRSIESTVGPKTRAEIASIRCSRLFVQAD
ncbi:MAG: tetratricopeptide repeat protein [Parvularculaceae bacterium]